MFNEQNLLIITSANVKHKTLYWLALAVLEESCIF